MLIWLDNQDNVAAKPNENFAREVMERCTLGEGSGYTETEKDVQEAARAFTGWRFTRDGGFNGHASFVFRRDLHDDGIKTFLGQSGKFDDDDILRILCAHPYTAEFNGVIAFSESARPVGSARYATRRRFSSPMPARLKRLCENS